MYKVWRCTRGTAECRLRPTTICLKRREKARAGISERNVKASEELFLFLCELQSITQGIEKNLIEIYG